MNNCYENDKQQLDTKIFPNKNLSTSPTGQNGCVTGYGGNTIGIISQPGWSRRLTCPPLPTICSVYILMVFSARAHSVALPPMRQILEVFSRD